MAIERQLIVFFVDGLHHDYLRMKVILDNPYTFQHAVRAALNELNLRKRFQIQSGGEYSLVLRYDEGRTEEPMGVDYCRPPKPCYKCNKKGHMAANFRSNYGLRINRVNVLNTPPPQNNGRQYQFQLKNYTR